MLAAGDDLRFICRRLCIFASEDIGLAEPMALVVAQNAAAAVDRVGLPEADIILGEAVVYLASAPKSNSSYLGIRAALKAVEEEHLMEVPYHLRNDGEGYIYPMTHPATGFLRHTSPNRGVSTIREGSGPRARIKERLKLFWKRFADDPEEGPER